MNKFKFTEGWIKAIIVIGLYALGALVVASTDFPSDDTYIGIIDMLVMIIHVIFWAAFTVLIVGGVIVGVAITWDNADKIANWLNKHE